jgi:hypothetical protein
MTARDFTVVCIPDDSREPNRLEDIEAKTFVAFVSADGVNAAYAAGQIAAAESEIGPKEPIDWAVVYVAAGHHPNLADKPDSASEV